ncbi:hypothetical protein FD04_GL001354 [Secundilactobacillus odoratitofui DSM 19909 = JCM 15043]|uniref:Uncharacterized protein n=1 Tax=Secundilactobacillus odoratitofui DSM 19909 = JCM 15043 TaxID=1423776 RepID=A0A0R1LWT2_9LACO|nr:hypothetical protein FD04_GL001354 [Secundilactobacillus odoratitofui DSM 19909 = JCM 15043]
MCGEYRYELSHKSVSPGSPPHVRRILADAVKDSAELGITSACAENTTTSNGVSRVTQDHLRMCGEYTKQIPLYQHSKIAKHTFLISFVQLI